MQIGFVTDEISPDVQEAIEIGVSWGIRHYELRVIGKNRIPHIRDYDLQKILDLKKQYDLRITALSPGVFKESLKNEAQITREITETLPETFRLAKLLGTKIVIIFGIRKSDGDDPEDENSVLDILRRVANAAQMEDITIAIENEPGFWCDTGKNTARILQKIDSPFLRANWDPANAVGIEKKPFPDGYKMLKKWISNVHIKDTIKGALIECVPIGKGVVDWSGQMRALLHDSPVDHVTIETHCKPLIEKSHKNLDNVKKLLTQ